MTRAAKRACWLLALAAVVGCATVAPGSPTMSPPQSSPAIATASAPPATASRRPVTPSPYPSDDEFAKMVKAVSGGAQPAGSELDELWRWIVDDEMASGQGSYYAPAKVVAYRNGYVPKSQCALGRPAREWANNARFCGVEDTIYFDEDFLRDFRAKAGNFAPAALLAHEWGHHVQALLGIATKPDTYSIGLELQADCFAGIFVGDREKIEDGAWSLGTDDLDAATAAFFALGNTDYSASDWFGPTEHGSQLQRLLAFGTGYQGSVGPGSPFGRVTAYFPWCSGYSDFRPEEIVELGGSGSPSLVVPPGRDTNQLAKELVIEPLTMAAVTSSRLRLRVLPPGVPLIDDVNERLPGMRTVPGLGTPTMPTSIGDIVFLVFEQGAGEDIRSGLYGSTVLADQSTLVLIAERDEPAPSPDADPATTNLAEEIMALSQLANRLCVPGQSGQPGPQFSAACAASLQ